MRVLLIYPYYTDKIRSKDRVEFPPLGLLYIASSIEALGHVVDVISFENPSFEIKLTHDYDIIGYGITASVTYPMFLKINPNLIGKSEFTIAGNCHVNIFPEKVLSELNLDKVFVGESEDTIQKYISSPDHKKEIIRGSNVDINNIPFPARHLLPDNHIYLNNRIGGQLDNAISMISTRGCLSNCSFCAVYNKKTIRYRSFENFEREVEFLKYSYPNVSGIVLLDENFTINNEHVLGISKVLKNYNFPWECNSRVDTLNRDNIISLAKNGCAEAKLGLESGSMSLLKKMNKKIAISQIEDVMNNCKMYGLSIKLYLMHGFPGENMQTTNETIDFLERNKHKVSRIALYRFSPLPGSGIFNSHKIRKRNWGDYTIYSNDLHWFGSDEEYEIVNSSYVKLNNYINQTFKQ